VGLELESLTQALPLEFAIRVCTSTEPVKRFEQNRLAKGKHEEFIIAQDHDRASLGRRRGIISRGGSCRVSCLSKDSQ
jgi:hypothetical protein